MVDLKFLEQEDARRNTTAQQPTTVPENKSQTSGIDLDFLNREDARRAQASNTSKNTPIESSFLERLPSLAVNPVSVISPTVAAGALNAILNQGANIANLFGANLPLNVIANKYPNANSMEFRGGELGGDILGYLGLGELGGTALGASKALPYIGKAVETISSANPWITAGRNIAGNVAYGATMSPENRASGALYGGALSGLGEALPAIPKAIEYLKPSKLAKGLTDDIKNYQDAIEKQNDVNYAPIHEIGSNEVIPEQYLDLNQDLLKRTIRKDSGFSDINEKYGNKPTVDNLRQIISHANDKMSEIWGNRPISGKLKTAEKNTFQDYQAIKDAAKSGLTEHLNEIDPKLNDILNSADAFHAQYVSPARILSGKLDKIKSEEPGDIFEAIKDAERLDNIPPQILSNIKSLGTRLGVGKALQTGAGIVLGAGIASKLPFMHGAEEPVGAYLGARFSPAIAHGLNKTYQAIPKNIRSSLANYLSEGYPIMKSAALAGSLSGY